MSIASLLRSEKPRELTHEEENLKRTLYERIPPRRRKFIDRMGYENWDPFPEPNEPMEMRTDITKRTAQQQTPLEILRVCNDPAVVRGHQRQRTVFALPKLTISDDKVLLLEIIEKNGARHQTVEIPAKELLEAKLL